MNKSQKNIWLTIVFIGLFVHSFGQNIELKGLTSLKTRNPINKVYKNYIFNNEIILLSDSRKIGELDILIVVLNQDKEVIREQIIGVEGVYDRPIGLIKKDKGYWLCANSTQNGKTTFQLYELDEAFAPVDYQIITIDNLSEVSTMEYDVINQQLILSATVTDKQDNMYPRLIKYDLVKNTSVQIINFNNRTDKEIAVPRKVSVPILKMDKNTNKPVVDKNDKIIIEGYKEIEKFDPLSKECNQIKCINDDCSEMLLIGQEISINYTDFWVTKVKNGDIIWEKIYKTRLGGDVAMDVFFDPKTETILVGGIGYNKVHIEEKDYYYYRVIRLDNNGALLDNYVYKSKDDKDTRSMYSKMAQIGDSYAILGGTQNIISYAKSFTEDNQTTPSDLYLVLVNESGDLKTEKVIETQSVDIPYSCIVLSDTKIWVIFSENEGMKILDVIITDKK